MGFVFFQKRGFIGISLEYDGIDMGIYLGRLWEDNGNLFGNIFGNIFGEIMGIFVWEYIWENHGNIIGNILGNSMYPPDPSGHRTWLAGKCQHCMGSSKWESRRPRGEQ